MKTIRFLGKLLLYCFVILVIFFTGMVGIVVNSHMKRQFPLDFRIDSLRMIHIEIDDSIFANKNCYLLDMDISFVHYEQRSEVGAHMPRPIHCVDSIVDLGIYSAQLNDSAISIDACSNKAFDSIESIVISAAETKDSTLIPCDIYTSFDELKCTIHSGIHSNQQHRLNVTEEGLEGFFLICFDKGRPRPSYILLNMKDTCLRGEVVNADKPKKYKLYEIEY